MKLRIIPLALLSIVIPALAQQQPPKDAAASRPDAKQAITKVEVKGTAEDYDPRRDDTASKTVINHEEIIKYGDTNVYEVLKRAPGVTVIGNTIRMRGLGGNYTQILVNGERPPPGFSLETLPPEQIDRIEVVRAATAEHSMQAIAGTINIILKKVVSKPQRDIRINMSRSDEQKNLILFGTIADKVDNLSYYLNPIVGRNLREAPSVGTDQFTLPNGQVTQLRDSSRISTNRNTFGGLQPRLNWKMPNEDQLNFSGFLQVFNGEGGFENHITNRIGSFGNPDYVDMSNHNDSDGRFLGGEINWIGKIAGGKLDAKLTAHNGRFNTENRSLSSTLGGGIKLRRDSDTINHNRTYSSTGKYTRTLFEGHALAAGWEVNQQRTEDDVHRVEGIVGKTPLDIFELFKPRVTRYAAYGQDEWNVNKNWSVYLGARWEGIRTDSEGTGLDTAQSRSHVLSPVAQTLFKFPDKSGRQLRLALTRTYKAPNTNQLTARRFEADENTRFNPDSSGNPDLKPELATGIDLTYEHFWYPGAVFSVSTSQRRITDYIRNKLTQDRRGLWLIQPLNDGSATVRTFDVELKFPLKAVMAENAPPFDFRASFNRNWSKVETVPGPDNRLDDQIPLTANLGLDYRADKFSAGGSFVFRDGGPVRVSEQQYRRLFPRREVEAYLLYKFKPTLQLRLAVNNALGEDNRSESHYVDVNGTSQSWSRSADSARFQANLEMKF
jgi:outer membrane receptor for ferrienterochelin and colicins